MKKSGNEYINNMSNQNLNIMNRPIINEAMSLPNEMSSSVFKTNHKKSNINNNRYDIQNHLDCPQHILKKKECQINDSVDIKINLVLNINFNLKDQNVNK